MSEDQASNDRVTINQLNVGIFAHYNDLAKLDDHGARRYRVWGSDFDTRAVLLATEIGEHWEPGIKEQWKQNKNNIAHGLRQQYGELGGQRKVQNFTDMGGKPFSILAYHNGFFEQVRASFTIGAYYPALTGVCAMGERILNHLILDLRESFRSTPEYKSVYRKSSFQDWGLAIDTLNAWGVLLSGVSEAFGKLAILRNKSIHFNHDTYENLRHDALSAIKYMSSIIEHQFGTYGRQPWFIEGIKGASFIKREYEMNPFIQKYYLPQSPFVGVNCGIEFDDQNRAEFIDYSDYGDVEMTDEEFCEAFNNRDIAEIAKKATSQDF